MKIYTKTGDDGTTGLFGGARVHKTDDRVEAYGTVDELNSFIGLARSASLDPFADNVLAEIQDDLFVLGAEFACAPGKEDKLSMRLVTADDATRLERAIDEAEASLAPLKTFILPGGTKGASYMHVARTVCRRAERAVLRLTGIRGETIVYLNRLSDLLFTLARRENARHGQEDVPWVARK